MAPASPLLTARELAAFLRQVRARFVVADAGALHTAAEAARAAGVETVLALGSLPECEPCAREPVDPQAIALLMSSSGTTGLPKSAAHTHVGAVAMLRGFTSFPLTRLGADDVVGGVLPMAHIFGSVLLNATLRAGARIVTLPRFEPRGVPGHGAGAPRHGRGRSAAAGAGPGPPSAGRPLRPPSLRLVLIGAAPCPDRDRARVPRAPGLRGGASPSG